MSGLPCVTTNVGAMGEVARDDDTALVVQPRDAAALAAALARLVEDAVLRRRLGQAARAFALERCTLAAMCDAMEEVFRSVLAARRDG
jgi:glycosyltransferase involved in cell wall biosynthesis